MSGFITKVEIENNAELVKELYGQDVYEAALNSEGETFLGLLAKLGKI